MKRAHLLLQARTVFRRASFLATAFFSWALFSSCLVAQDVTPALSQGAVASSQSSEAPLLPPAVAREVFLDEVVRVDFSPTQAFFLVMAGRGTYSRIEATLVPPLSAGAPSGGAVRAAGGLGAQGAAIHGPWRAGAKILLPPGASRIDFSLIVVGEGNRFALVPPRNINPSDEQFFGGAIDVLREYLLKRKQESRSWQTQIDAQDDSLRRLRADADIVADLGRIVEVREDIDRVKQSIRGLQQDQANLEEFLRLARTAPQPRNFASRERQLTKQIVELADIAKGTETGEFGRRSEAEKEVQRKLVVVEKARGLDFDELQRELVQLRKRKRDLTGASSLGESPAHPPVAEAPEDYAR